jgi:RecJ-like exonuclease
MKKLLFIVGLITIFAVNVHAKNQTYGKGVQVENATAISAILDDPDAYIGKTVKIEGMIIEVCAKRGCWVYVAGDRQGEKFQVKVTDGEIVFPMSASGQMAAVEGIVEELKISREEMIKYLQHMAEEKGQPFDPATVKDERMIRIVGLGAEIEG